ncbi:glycosyltransferase family 39 protein [Verrucosispora sp. WMMD573]|uniref:glycosyltransferase family 39 protein n=1 Tax=Verrucosispora sp. WMMD573 TaxID=3015149 RepID=UPI00248C08B8|nr:glycosyltransferase family 39 protein [Verrucosispora sp. WMMD573]WBB52257.1 glycosyltransferase family 39 protein [Verrucosispora sp. WMMD573]
MTFPALVVAALGLWRLTRPALWADELATWGAVRLSWSQLWQLSGSVDAVLTPYYVLMKVYTDVVGTSTVALRLPSVVAITVATLVVTALGHRLGGARLGLVAGLVFAVLPVTSRYAQEARGYSFVILGAAVALLYLTRLVDRPGRGDLVGYATAVGITGLIHPLNGLLMLAGHAAAIAWWQLRYGGSSWRVTRRWAVAAAVGVLPAATLSVWGSGQTAQVSWIGLITLRSLPIIPERIFLSAAIGGLVLTLAVLGVRRTPQRVVVAAAAFVPMGVLFVAGTQLPVWAARYVLVVLPAMAVLAAAALIRFGRAHAAAAIGLAAILAYPGHVTVRGEAGHSQASLRIAPIISPRYQSGDVAVFPDTHYSIPWSPRDIYERYLPEPRPHDVLRTAPQRSNGRFLAAECPDATCLGVPPRIWVIRADNSLDPLKDMAAGKREKIEADYRVVQRWQHPLLGITLMTRKES